MSHETITEYYAAFNAGDSDGMLNCVTDDVEHRINEGDIRRGLVLFEQFCAHLGGSYREILYDNQIFNNEAGTRATAEFPVHGQFLKTDSGLPVAKCPSYVLPSGAFFRLRGDRISRIATFYNLNGWTRQVAE